MKIINVANLQDGLSTIRAALAESPAPPIPSLEWLNINEIHLCEPVFQRRDTEWGTYDQEGHVRSLMGAIGNPAKPKHLDPITIWWSGLGWVVIDGHHRVKAYDALGYCGAIPCRVFEGTLEEALVETAEGNSKDKLPMTKAEKQQSAIFLECTTMISKAKLAAATGVSARTIANIRKVIRSLTEKGYKKGDLAQKHWKELKEMDELPAIPEPQDDYDEWTRKKADEIKAALLPIIDGKPITCVMPMVIALSEISPRLPFAIHECPGWEPGEVADVDSEY